MTETQNKLILDALKRGERITPLDALDRFGCLRLSGRICDLRRAGHRIKTHTVSENGKRYACYYLEQ